MFKLIVWCLFKKRYVRFHSGHPVFWGVQFQQRFRKSSSGRANQCGQKKNLGPTWGLHGPYIVTPQKTSIPHLGRRKMISKHTLGGDILVSRVELPLASNPVQLLVVDTPHRPLAGSPFNRTGLATARSPSSISKAVLTRCHGMATVLFQQLQIRISYNIKVANCFWFYWKSSESQSSNLQKKCHVKNMSKI